MALERPALGEASQRSVAKTVLPLLQGDLDYFCSIYAVLNLLTKRGILATIDDQQLCFNRLVWKISTEGNLPAYLTEGVDEPDVEWLLETAGFRDILAIEGADLPNVRQVVESRRDVMIYASEDGDSDDCFTHYTLTDTVQTNHIQLLDSYKFECMKFSANRWRLGAYRVKIVKAWAIGEHSPAALKALLAEKPPKPRRTGRP